MARYTEESKERVRDAVDMVDLVGARTELRRAGSNRLQGLCPFHEERTPSFGIDPVRKVFHCFGCGEGGDAFRFVELTEGVDFKGALEYLADRYGVHLETDEEDPQAAERRRARERLHELLERAAAFYVRYLWESAEAAPAREYLAGRGLEEGFLREFRVGYAPSAWDTVLLATRRAGFTNRELWDAGLAQRARGEGRLFDRFRRRIMFPLCDLRGRVLGFGARAIGADQQPKYVNSADNAVYHKGRNLFGADIARAHATKAGTVILAEGYTDVIAMHQAGLRNTVGLMGTALTEEQVTELARLAPVVQLALDADSAGQEAMLRASRMADQRKLKLRMVPLPSGMDPAELVQAEGARAIQHHVDAAIPIVQFVVERVLDGADLRSAEGRSATIDRLKPILAGVEPGPVHHDLIRRIADRLDAKPDVVANLLQPRIHASRNTRDAPDANLSRQAIDRQTTDELDFLAQALANGADGIKTLSGLELEGLLRGQALELAAALRDHGLDGIVPWIDGHPDFARSHARVSVRAAELEPNADELEAARLRLEMNQLDREIARARREGFAQSPLVLQRAKVKAMWEALKEDALERSRRSN